MFVIISFYSMVEKKGVVVMSHNFKFKLNFIVHSFSDRTVTEREHMMNHMY